MWLFFDLTLRQTKTQKAQTWRFNAMSDQRSLFNVGNEVFDFAIEVGTQLIEVVGNRAVARMVQNL